MFYLAELKLVSIQFQQFHAFYHMKPKLVFETIEAIIEHGFAAEPKVYILLVYFFCAGRCKTENSQEMYLYQAFVFGLVVLNTVMSVKHTLL